MKRIKIFNKKLVKIFLILIFLSMLILNYLTPILADDYSYSIAYDYTRITNLVDIIKYQSHHYMTWGGRSVAHTIVQIFLIMPKWIFNICNSGVYTAIVYLIYLLAKDNKKKDKPSIMLLIHLLIFFFVPVFGQNCLWLDGSCNYIWTMLIILLLIYQYKNKDKTNDTKLRIIMLFILGIFAGWTNENTSFGLIVILSSILIRKKVKHKKIKRWQISGLIGNVIGFLILILAPGNYVRKSYFQDESSIIIRLIKRFMICTTGMYTYCFILLSIIVILGSIYIYNHKKINNYVYIFLLGSILSCYPMLLSPEFPERSWFGIIVFLIVAIAILTYSLDDIHRVFKIIVFDILVISTIIYLYDYYNAAKDIYTLKTTWDDRIKIIKKSKKNQVINLEIYSTNNSKNPNYRIPDLEYDMNLFPNTYISKYYNIKGISGIDHN